MGIRTWLSEPGGSGEGFACGVGPRSAIAEEVARDADGERPLAFLGTREGSSARGDEATSMKEG